MSNHQSPMFTGREAERYSIARGCELITHRELNRQEWTTELATGPSSGPTNRPYRFFFFLGRPPSNNFLHYVMGPRLGFLVDAPDVFPDDSEKEEVHTGEKCDHNNHGREALGRVQPELGIDGIQGVKKGC